MKPANIAVFALLFISATPAIAMAESQASSSVVVGITPWIVLVVVAIVRVFCCFLETAEGFSVDDDAGAHEGRTAEV